MKRIVVENLRSAYNVGNIVRTADALGWGVVRVGYTARKDHKGVQKTALGSQEVVPCEEYETIQDFRESKESELVYAAELTDTSIALSKLEKNNNPDRDVYVVLGNEVTGVESLSLEKANRIIHIPMLGIKESLNVGQAAAIIMWELSR